MQSNQARLHVSGGGSGIRCELRSQTLGLSDDNWHHIGWSSGDLSAGVVQADYTCVIDGVDETANVTVNNDNLVPASNNGVTPFIGVRAPLALDYVGFMDEVAVYDVRLSVAEFQQIYNQGGTGKPGDLANTGPQNSNLQLWARNGDNDVFPNITNQGVGSTELDMVMTDMKASDIVGEVP